MAGANRPTNPDEEVAYGAAVQGVILTGEDSSQVHDLLLLSDSFVHGSGNCWWRIDQTHGIDLADNQRSIIFGASTTLAHCLARVLRAPHGPLQ